MKPYLSKCLRDQAAAGTAHDWQTASCERVEMGPKTETQKILAADKLEECVMRGARVVRRCQGAGHMDGTIEA